MLVHAAGLSAFRVQRGTYAVVLAAKDEAELKQIEIQLQDARIAHYAYREPDCDDELVSIGVYPVETRKEVKRVLSKLPLLWKNKEG